MKTGEMEEFLKRNINHKTDSRKNGKPEWFYQHKRN